MSRKRTSRTTTIRATEHAITGLLEHRDSVRQEYATATGLRRWTLGLWLCGSTKHEDRLRGQLRRLQETSATQGIG